MPPQEVAPHSSLLLLAGPAAGVWFTVAILAFLTPIADADLERERSYGAGARGG